MRCPTSPREELGSCGTAPRATAAPAQHTAPLAINWCDINIPPSLNNGWGFICLDKGFESARWVQAARPWDRLLRWIFKAYKSNFISICGLQSTLGWSVKAAAALQDLLHHTDFLLYVPLGLQEGKHHLPLYSLIEKYFQLGESSSVWNIWNGQRCLQKTISVLDTELFPHYC